MSRPDAPATGQVPPPATAVTDRRLTVHVVAHTHWDREWYQPAARFQARLVALIDAWLEAGPDVASPFLLDGQTIVLADYLAVRPERTSDVVHALRSGALEAGPWYVLADNLIPSGEAIVRNLEAGRRWLRRQGAPVPRVAYCPDTFGHPSALPSIAAEFGCDVAVVWRGFGGRSFPVTDTAWWYGADQHCVLLYHLPPDGYELGSALPSVRAAAEARWRLLSNVLRARNHTGVALLTVGADHHAPQPDLTDAIASVSAAARVIGDTVQRASLSQAAGALKLAADERATPLPAVHGELRDSYGYTWTLPGTLATRAHQKRRNAHIERTLLRDVEPWTGLAWLHGTEPARAVSPNGSITLAQIPTLVALAWEALLRTHPHDTLCGCSIDDVAVDMAARQRRAAALATEVREAALTVALQHDRVAARERPVREHPLTVVRNRVAYERGGVAELTLLQTLGDVRVGPQSAGGAVLDPPIDAAPPALHASVVQSLDSRVTHARRESPQHYPDDDLVREHRVLAWVEPVPGLGVRVLDADSPAASTLATPRPVVTRSIKHGLELSNGQITIRATPAGVFIMSGNRQINDALLLETVVDRGDSYTPSLRGEPQRLSLNRIRRGHNGPLRASVRLLWTWRDGHERLSVWTELSLDAESALVQCRVRGFNARRDHRLQLSWRTDVGQIAGAAPTVRADAAFGPVVRVPIDTVPHAQPFEQPPLTMPLHRWLSHADHVRGATLLSDGLAEGQAIDGHLSVTLVRAVGELSRNDLPERPGHAGWPCATPASQCRGPFSAAVALLLHDTWHDYALVEIERAADAFLLPLTGETWRDLGGETRLLAGPSLHGDHLVASAVHVSDDGQELVLRCINLSERPTRGHWQLPEVSASLGALEARRTRMDGTPEEPWNAASPSIEFDAAPRAIITHRVRRV